MKPVRMTFEPRIHAHPRGDVLRWLLSAHNETLASYGVYYPTHVLVIASIADCAAILGERRPIERGAETSTICVPTEPAKLLRALRPLHPELAAAIEARLARRQGGNGVVAVMVSALDLVACCGLAPIDDALAAGGEA